MGGPGSTRWRGHTPKPLAEQSLAFKLHRLVHDADRDPRRELGQVRWSDGATDQTLAVALYAVVGPRRARDLVVIVTRDGRRPGASDVVQELQLEWVPTLPQRGRYFAHCPTCERRMTKAFWPLSHDHFECRICAGVTNASNQREDRRINAYRRDPDACLAAIEGLGQPGYLGTRAHLALKALPPWLDPFQTPRGARHPGGQRLMGKWAGLLFGRFPNGQETAD